VGRKPLILQFWSVFECASEVVTSTCAIQDRIRFSGVFRFRSLTRTALKRGER
jgi:hypothetical protein